MRTRPRLVWLFIAFFFLPLLSSGQSPESQYAVSVRELSIPPKALHAYEQGAVLLFNKEAAASLPYFQRAVAAFAGYYEAYYEIGVANLKLLRPADAEKAFQTSIELSGGEYAPSVLALGAVLDYQEKFAEAEAVARRGLDLYPASWAAHYYLGRALFGLNRLGEAEELVREGLRQKPDSLESLRLLADIHGRKKDYRALVDDLDEYLKLDPDSPIGIRAKAIRETAQRILDGSQNTTALAQSQP